MSGLQIALQVGFTHWSDSTPFPAQSADYREVTVLSGQQPVLTAQRPRRCGGPS